MTTPNVFGSVTTQANCDGEQANETVEVSGTVAPKASLKAPASITGTVSDSSGSVLALVNALAGSEVLCIFWLVGNVVHALYDCTMSAHSGTHITVTGGTYLIAGDSALPANATAVTVAVAQDASDSLGIIGSNLQQLLCKAAQPGLIELLDSGPASLFVTNIPVQAGLYHWEVGQGVAVPFSGTAVKARFYNNSTVVNNMTVKSIVS